MDREDDLISRQAAVNILANGLDKIPMVNNTANEMVRRDERIICIQEIRSLPNETRWIPIETRPMTEEERQYYSEMYGYDVEYEEAVMFDCKMPEDEQEIWVCSKCGNVWEDTCVVDEGIGLEENGDWLDIVAWMPFYKPKPWKGEEDV